MKKHLHYLKFIGRTGIIFLIILTVFALPAGADSGGLPPQNNQPTVDPNPGEGVIANESLQILANTSWPQVQGDAHRSGYVPQTVGPPFTELWRIGKYAPNPTDSMFPVSSRVQPIIAQGLIFMPSNDGSLYALSTANGAVVWSYASQGPLVNSAGYENGRVFFGSTDGYIYALNAANGSLVWRYKTGSTVKTAPLLAEGKVFMGGSDGYMVALNQAGGALAWRTKIGAPIFDTAAYDNGKIFFGGMDSKGYALNAATGAVIWSKVMYGQGFRDRWTVAGNGRVFFTPMLAVNHHVPLSDGTRMFSNSASPAIFNQSWTTQRQEILQYLVAKPYQRPLYVVDQNTGAEPFIPPVLFASGGSQSPHAQPVLLPNGNANVTYRRSFGEPAKYGQTTNDALYTGELGLANGDILPVDWCIKGSGGWEDCGPFKSPMVSDESTALMRTGNIIYLDTARGTVGLDTASQTTIPLAVYNNSTGSVFANSPVVFYPGKNEWIYMGEYTSVLSEVSSDGNDLKRPTPVVGDTFYIFHYNTLVAVKGVLK